MCPPVTLRQLYLKGKQILTEAGLESPAFDALCLMQISFGIADRAALTLKGGEVVSPDAAREYLALIDRRLREPLQYILGQWEFDGMPLAVGEGVLVPREDTLALVEAAASCLQGQKAPRILDLCAGTGAVALSLLRRIPDARAVCVEWSPQAIPYLRRNLETFGDGRAQWVAADVLTAPDGDWGYFDAIVSNPPYIPSADVEGLQWEVQCEPRMALDGGTDGLNFYRAICSQWLPLLRAGGTLAFEIGYDIREGVEAVMRQHTVTNITHKQDINGVDRCLFGTVG